MLTAITGINWGDDILKRSFSEFETSERDSQDGAGSQGGEYASEGAFKHFRFFLF